MIMSKVGSNISFKQRSSWAHSFSLRLGLGFGMSQEQPVFGFLSYHRMPYTVLSIMIQFSLCFTCFFFSVLLFCGCWICLGCVQVSWGGRDTLTRPLYIRMRVSAVTVNVTVYVCIYIMHMLLMYVVCILLYYISCRSYTQTLMLSFVLVLVLVSSFYFTFTL